MLAPRECCLNDTLKSTVESAIAENDSHLGRMRWARTALSGHFPLDEGRLAGLSDEKRAILDQFLYRFTKIQDSMGTRLLPTLYNFLEGDDNPRPFLDVLNRLEQLGVVKSQESWQKFRDLRNNIAHEYPESVVKTIATINTLFEDVEEFFLLYTTARQAGSDRLR